MADLHPRDWRLAPLIAAIPVENREGGAAFAEHGTGPANRSRTGTRERLARRMFEFGKGLRRIFAPEARGEADDLSWTELVMPELLAREARGQCTDAGRVSAARPFEAWLRGSVLWREHARRTGADDSLGRARDAARSAARAARTPDQTVRAAVEAGLVEILRFDLVGGVAELEAAVRAAPDVQTRRNTGLSAATLAAVAALDARLRSRQARLDGKPDALRRAALALDEAVAAAEVAGDPELDPLRLERAALALEAGVMRRDPSLLDQAGRELRRLVSAADPDRRPLSRARALCLCAAGLSALAALAGDEAAHAQARILFDAAADQFTPDHSPIDWTAIQLARAATPGAVSLAALLQAEAVSAGKDLTLGALARDRRLEVEAAAAGAAGDADRLDRMAAEVRRRLVARRLTARPGGEARHEADSAMLDRGDLDWAVDQIGLARIEAAIGRLTGAAVTTDSAFALFEAAEIARERGVPTLAESAERLMPVRSVKA